MIFMLRSDINIFSYTIFQVRLKDNLMSFA